MTLNLSKNMLSHKEQLVYLYLEGQGKSSFRASDLDCKELGLGQSHLYVIISRLVKKGWMTRVRNGVYLRLPASVALEGKSYLEDPFDVALGMYPGYLAFQSALRVHGLSEHEPFTIFVATEKKSETVPLLEHYEVRAVKVGRRFAGFEEKGRYSVSTVTKTLFDCLYHPQFAGGYSNVLKSLHAAKVDWTEMVEYAEDFGSPSLCQKIGYMISLLCKETGKDLPSDCLEYLKGRVKNKTRLDFALGGGKYSREWMVIDNIGKRKLLSWWYDG